MTCSQVTVIDDIIVMLSWLSLYERELKLLTERPCYKVEAWRFQHYACLSGPYLINMHVFQNAYRELIENQNL